MGELHHKLDRQFALQEASLDEIDRQIKLARDYNQHRPSIYPAAGRITSRYGSRVHPIFERSLVHAGIDIAARIGTPVSVTADGIATTGFSDTYGRYVLVDHGNGFSTFYAHLSKITIPNGSPVHRGQMVGYVGETGLCTGPHLHYEVRKGQGTLNPEQFFLPTDFVID
jgi:murein DD-endopeptidase MepM/ murein hydrolase activator NlpD